MRKIIQIFMVALIAVVAATAEKGEEFLKILEAFDDVQDAIMVSDLEKVKEIVIREPEVINYRSPNGMMILHYAVLFADHGRDFIPDILLFLLYSGADPDAQNNEGNTPLHLIARKGSPIRGWDENVITMAELLLNKGADINLLNNENITPLEMAVKYNNYFIADKLIERGADYTIHIVSELGKTDLVSAFLKKEPGLIHAKDNNGRTPVHCVSSKPKNTGTRFLLAKDFTPLKKRNVEHDQLETIKLLINNGVDVHSRDEHGWTPLHCAAESDRDDILEILFAAGADADAYTKGGDTALHLAARKGNKGIVELLIKQGANIYVKNDLGETPLRCAKTLNYADIVTILREKGAVEVELNSEHTWSAYLKDPYSNTIIAAHLATCREIPTQSFASWYISDVFKAKRMNKPSVTVVQIYDGKHSGFKLGCLIVFDHNGSLLRTIMRERVLVRLLYPDFDFKIDYPKIREKIANREIVDLPDINGDGYAEIPTQRWFDYIDKKPQPEKNSIYLTNDDSIPCGLSIEFYDDIVFIDSNKNNPWPLNDIEYGILYLKRRPETATSVKVVCQPFKPKYTSSGMISGARRDNSRPEQDLETYIWDSEKHRFTGPAEGPNGLWKVVTEK